MKNHNSNRNYSTSMKQIIWLLLIFIASLGACKQSEKALTVAFYNTENLFDIEDDPHINDNEFLPNSEKKWDMQRYQKKLNDLARVLSEIDTVSLPVFIGLCEVENRRVLDDLIATTPLLGGNYAVAHFDSPDMRGIDVALLYRPEIFKLNHSEAIKIVFEDEPKWKTRDILHVTGKIKSETFHLFVNHWPSRIGGEEETEAKRMQVASILKKKVDEIQDGAPKANIIIMGDMNDEPVNKSLFETLGAKAPGTNSKLINLMIPLDEQNQGSYFYRGSWTMLDNLVVSSTLTNGKGFEAAGGEGHVFRNKWMEFTNKKGESSPNRTFGGSNYYGGVSDHFPVYFILKAK